MKTAVVRAHVRAELSAEKSTMARDLAGNLNSLLIQGKMFRNDETECMCATLQMYLYVVGALLNNDSKNGE